MSAERNLKADTIQPDEVIKLAKRKYLSPEMI